MFGYRLSVSKKYVNRLLTIIVRHNGEYRISTPEGLEVKSGTIPLEYLQNNRLNAPATNSKSSSSYADFDPMSDLKELDI